MYTEEQRISFWEGFEEGEKSQRGRALDILKRLFSQPDQFETIMEKIPGAFEIIENFFVQYFLQNPEKIAHLISKYPDVDSNMTTAYVAYMFAKNNASN